MAKKRLKSLLDLRRFMADIMKGIIYHESENDILERLEQIEEKI